MDDKLALSPYLFCPFLIPNSGYLSLDLKANSAGLKCAEVKAKEIGVALENNRFCWFVHGKGQPKADQRSIADLLPIYEADYFDKVERTPKTESSFKSAHLNYLKRLPQIQRLTRDLLEHAIKATKPNTSTRRAMCIALNRFGKFFDVDVDFIDKELKGTYCSCKPAPRDLPDDDEIVECFHKILDRGWAWVYGMIATYGLRPHEVFHLDTRELEQGGFVVEVLKDTKTGYRAVRPLHPEWIDQFGLRQKQLPEVTGKDNSKLGAKVTPAFRRYKIPFPAYHLRHCYAIRCIEFDIPASIAARWMGHTVKIHTTVYQAWISRLVEDRVFERAISQQNRPQPPGSV